MNRRGFMAAVGGAIAFVKPAQADAAAEAVLPPVEFSNIDGGTHSSADWAGRPVLVINSASRCGFTLQYEQMQEVHERYGPRGLIVLAVPSDDFRQELDNAEAVKEFCDVQFGLTLPMTDITHVKGRQAHPFYAWMRDVHGWVPRWNFNKVLIGADGRLKGTWRSRTRPNARDIRERIEAELTS